MVGLRGSADVLIRLRNTGGEGLASGGDRGVIAAWVGG